MPHHPDAEDLVPVGICGNEAVNWGAALGFQF